MTAKRATESFMNKHKISHSFFHENSRCDGSVGKVFRIASSVLQGGRKELKTAKDGGNEIC